MAALIPSYKSPLFALNGRQMQTFTVAITENAQGDDYVVTDLGFVEGVLGHCVISATASPAQNTTDPTELPLFVLNRNGTGTASVRTDGSVGIEVLSADLTFQFTVVGLLQA